MSIHLRTLAAAGSLTTVLLLAACGGKATDPQPAPAAEPAPAATAEEEPAAALSPERAVFAPGCLELKPVDVGPGIKQPTAMIREYPDLPGGVRVKGRVVLEAIVDAKGAVCDARVVEGLEPRLDRACVESLKRWAFTPARLRGDPVPVFFSVTIKFDTN